MSDSDKVATSSKKWKSEIHIWQNIETRYTMHHTNNVKHLTNEFTIAFSQWIHDYVDRYGWNPFFMTFMFKSLQGGQQGVLHQMSDEIERVYSTFVTRVVRKPNSIYQKYLNARPILIAVPDRPVAKHQKQRFNDVTINDGRHMHGILVVPWNSRLKTDVVSHFEKFRRLYVKNCLLRLDVRAIESNLPGVVDYAFKSMKGTKFGYDDIVIFPKSEAELRHRTRPHFQYRVSGEAEAAGVSHPY